MADSNIVKKPLLEKIQDLLERQPGMCDVAFCVGKEKKIVKALKVILKASSPFLEKEFKEKWEVAVVQEGDMIQLPDFDPIAFELFIKLTSFDTWSLEILNTLSLPPHQILNLLSICRQFRMEEPVEYLEKMATTFLQSFEEYNETDDFLELSQTNLKSVLGSDDIEIKELDVFHAAMRWADFQCNQMKVEPTEEHIREVLGDSLFEIRFPLMTCAEFTEAQESKDILTAEENLGIYRFIGLTGSKKTKRMKFDWTILPFKTTPRNRVQTLESNPNSESNNSESLIPAGVSILGSTRGSESAKNPPIVCDDNQKAQLKPQSLESATSRQLSAAALLPKTIRWEKKVNGFPRRSEHAAVAVGNAIYSFGGDGDSEDPSYSRDVLDAFVLNVDEVEKKWKKLSVENSEANPNQRRGHSAVAHKEFVVIFGGEDTMKRKSSNSTYRFNTLTLKWDKPKVTGKIPADRYDHSAVVFGNEMLIYAGVGEEDFANDLHCLDLESFCWSTIETKGIPPSLRFGHSATVLNDKFILIFGGWDYDEKKEVNTILSFDLHNKTWTAVEISGTPPSSRMQHVAFVHNGRLYIFGGSGEDNSHLNDVFSYDPETFEWEEVTSTGEAPSPRDAAACVATNDQVFIFGGYNSDEGELDDTNVLQM